MFQILTQPTNEPVSLTEAKLHLRVDITADDNEIAGLVQAATEQVELWARRALVTQTLDYTLDAWPDGRIITLPRPPLVSVTSITYKSDAGVAATFSSTYYAVDADAEPGRVALLDSASWPSTALYPVSPIKVRYIAGYGAASAVPERYKQAIKLLCGHWYENREEVIATGMAPMQIPLGVRALLGIDADYRV